ncbi:MAG: hypothetical protein RL318_2561 [Fibrobacterota bacterium]|jgi:cobalt-precorrin 5A hydrolase
MDDPSLHVLFLHPSARLAAQRVVRDLGAHLHVHELDARPGESSFDRMATRLAELWGSASGLVVLAPTGVVVRSIAPLLRHKLTDPAVVCCDVHGRWAVSLVSGHEGGANRLAAQVATCLQAEPIITTTSEAARVHVAGIGCRHGVPLEILREALSLALEQAGLKPDDLRLLATSEAKRKEPGMVALADELDLPLRLLSHREIRTLRPHVRRSAASRHFPVPAVSEPAALLSGTRTRCILKKFIHRGVTVSIARELCAWSESDPATRSTAPAAPKPPSPHPPS